MNPSLLSPWEFIPQQSLCPLAGDEFWSQKRNSLTPCYFTRPEGRVRPEADGMGWRRGTGKLLLQMFIELIHWGIMLTTWYRAFVNYVITGTGHGTPLVGTGNVRRLLSSVLSEQYKPMQKYIIYIYYIHNNTISTLSYDRKKLCASIMHIELFFHQQTQWLTRRIHIPDMQANSLWSSDTIW